MGGASWITWLCWAGALALVLAGLAVAALALLRDRARGRRRCPKCWYSMEGLGLACPECGHAAGSERALFRTRRRWRWAALGAGLVVLGVGAGLTPSLRSRGFAPLVPTTVMIAGFGRLDPAFVERHLPGRVRGGLWGWQERMLVSRAADALTSADPARRRCAAGLMHDAADILKPAPERFATLLTDPDGQVRDYANGIVRLTVRPGEHADLIPKVEAAMRAESQYWTGLRMGSTLGCFGEEALPTLARTAADPDPRIRERAMWGLGRLGATSEGAVDLLVAAMRDADASVRRRAVHAVSDEVAPGARARLIAALRGAAGDADPEVALVAGARLELLGAPPP